MAFLKLQFLVEQETVYSAIAGCLGLWKIWSFLEEDIRLDPYQPTDTGLTVDNARKYRSAKD